MVPLLHERVLTKVNELRELNSLSLPAGYSAENALRSAWLILQDMKDRAGQPVLKTCTPDSVANALFNMVVQGLNPAKRQCSFVVYGDRLSLQREYAGSIALARRYSAMKEIHAGVIYRGDIFEYAIDTTTGMKRITRHEQQMENLDDGQILGAYAVVCFDDGSVNTEIMTMAQIRKSWDQGPTRGKSPAHQNFPGEMAKKTVINRACKLLIAASDDSILFEPPDEGRLSRARTDIEREANHGELIELPGDDDDNDSDNNNNHPLPLPEKLHEPESPVSASENTPFEERPPEEKPTEKQATQYNAVPPESTPSPTPRPTTPGF